MQKIHIVGYLAKDPEVRMTPAGLMVVNLNIPTADKWKDKTTGEWREETEWHRVVFFGKNAENAQKYLKKGSCIAVEGKLKTRKWIDKDTGLERQATDVMGEHYKMFGERNKAPQEASAAQYTRAKESPEAPLDDEIPF